MENINQQNSCFGIGLHSSRPPPLLCPHFQVKVFCHFRHILALSTKHLLCYRQRSAPIARKRRDAASMPLRKLQIGLPQERRVVDARLKRRSVALLVHVRTVAQTKIFLMAFKRSKARVGKDICTSACRIHLAFRHFSHKNYKYRRCHSHKSCLCPYHQTHRLRLRPSIRPL